jgi:hypothetical protein
MVVDSITVQLCLCRGVLNVFCVRSAQYRKWVETVEGMLSDPRWFDCHAAVLCALRSAGLPSIQPIGLVER